MERVPPLGGSVAFQQRIPEYPAENVLRAFQQDQGIQKIPIERRVSSADGKYMGSSKDRAIQARNGIVFIQAWIDLQLKRERRREIRRWLESKKTRVERQLEMLDRRVQEKGKT